MRVIGLIIVLGALAMIAGKRGLENILNAMAAAIKEFEGWYVGSRSYRNNNPGNLKYAGQPGATGADESGHAIFDSYASGWEALKNQLRIAFTGASRVYGPGDNFYDFFGKYAEGNAPQYAEFVAGKLGVSPFDTLGSLIS